MGHETKVVEGRLYEIERKNTVVNCAIGTGASFAVAATAIYLFETVDAAKIVGSLVCGVLSIVLWGVSITQTAKLAKLRYFMWRLENEEMKS